MLIRGAEPASPGCTESGRVLVRLWARQASFGARCVNRRRPTQQHLLPMQCGSPSLEPTPEVPVELTASVILPSSSGRDGALLVPTSAVFESQRARRRVVLGQKASWSSRCFVA